MEIKRCKKDMRQKNSKMKAINPVVVIKYKCNKLSNQKIETRKII